jgi:Avidin family
MKNSILFPRYLWLAVISFLGSAALAEPQDTSLGGKLVGKWTQEMIGARTGGAIINITAVDATTGRITGKYIPPSGPAGGKEFDVTGWISSAAPQEKADNVITVSFTVSLSTYGSISSETGYLKDNKIFAMWHNVRPNAAYDWAHIVTGEDIWTKTP